jgi:hypothetical protein
MTSRSASTPPTTTVDAVIADAARPLDLEPPTAKIQGSAPLLIVLGDQDRSVPIQDGLRVVDQVRVIGEV